MKHNLAWAPVAARAGTPHLISDPADWPQQRLSDGPLVLKSSLPLQPLRRQTGDCLQRRPQPPQPSHPVHPLPG